MKRVAVVLAGCGFLDGAEIRESVGVLWALSRHSVDVQIFAPDQPQAEVVNHLTGEAIAGETRNVLQEASRIARGKALPLSELEASEFDAIIMPGGFGVAKNLCTFATEGANGSVHPHLKSVLQHFTNQDKPIGAACIAPALIGLAFKGTQLDLTVGEESDASREIEKMGHRHAVTRPHEIHVDKTYHIVTTPAYMYDDAPLHEIFEGIRRMVDTVVGMIDEKGAE